MIEKIMKAVKSSNKKRGRNITVGAVIGFLLSCTAVMGADEYLWIKNDGGTIKFNTALTTDNDGAGGNWVEKNPYEESGNKWDETTYINNITLSSSANNGKDEYNRDLSYGLRLSGNLGNFNFINNGMVSGTSDNAGYGINILELNGSVDIKNEGVISGTGATTGNSYVSGYGINISESGGVDIQNEGLISGTVTSNYSGTNYGIYIEEFSELASIQNKGVISGTVTGESTGIYISSSSGVVDIKNEGVISEIGTGTVTGSGGGYGVNIYESTVENITNTGVIFGLTNAIYNDGPIDSLNNYGILANGSEESVVDGVTVVYDKKPEKDVLLNKGLIFKANGGTYSAETADFENFGTISEKDGYTIINAKAINDSEDDIGGTESITIENGTLTSQSQEEKISSDKKYILNGITDTLKVSERGNELNNSIVNAYGTAVVMDKDMSMLTLNNTVVNGGISDNGSTVNITGDGNTLTIQENSIINGKDVVIRVEGMNNAVTLEGDAKVNGKMESTGNNTLNLYGKTDDSMNMLNDISGFVNMNIDKNVTFFEDVKVTGTDTVTVYNTGVLNLRLKKAEDITRTVGIPKAIHAFSGTDGMKIKGTSAEEAGTLNFITNGIGKEIIVDMENIELENMKIKTSSVIDKVEINKDYIHLGAGSDLNGIVNPKISRYDSFNGIYKSLYNSTDENIDALRNILSMTFLGENYDYNNGSDEEQLKNLMSYLGSIYTETPYSYSSELSRRSMGMFRDIVTENHFRPDLDKWLIMGGLTHADGGTKDTYYGQNYHGFDTGTSDVDVDMKLTGAYALGKYGYSENVSLGVAVGGNRSEAELSMSKVKGNSGYIGAFAENYRGNLTLKAGAGIQYSEYDTDRRTIGGHSYSEKYSDMAYDIYLNGRYSHNIEENLFLEPYATLSYTYIDQDGADEGDKTLAIETDSKSFDYTVGKVGVDLKKVIPHEKGKSTLSAGINYTKILDGADEEHITGRFKGGTDFDILVAHKNEHSIGLNAKYTLELENGIIFDVKGTYSVERDSHNDSGKNRTKGEWIVGAGMGYKF